MIKHPWTKSEITALSSGATPTELAKALGRSRGAIYDQRRRMGLTVSVPLVTGDKSPATYEEDTAQATSDMWRIKHKEISAKYQKALKEKSVVDQLVADIRSLAPRSYSASPAILTQRKSTKETPVSAVLLVSDTHIGQVVDPGQTLSYGGYSFDIFLARLHYLQQSVESILQHHQVAPVEELVIPMLGDMLHGNLDHSVEAGQKNDLFSQFYNGSHALAQFIRALARRVPKVRIKTVVGNHPRNPNQKKMPSDQRYSNGDNFAYAMIQSLVRDIPNVEFGMDRQPMALFEVQNHTFLALHGDTLKGGGTAGIPALAYAKEVSSISQMRAAQGLKPVNFFVSGHIHKPVSLPTTSGACLTNGAFVGSDGYTMSAAFVPVEPQQRLFFLHPKHGITAEYCLSLKWAKVGETPPYELPKNFPMV